MSYFKVESNLKRKRSGTIYSIDHDNDDCEYDSWLTSCFVFLGNLLVISSTTIQKERKKTYHLLRITYNSVC